MTPHILLAKLRGLLLDPPPLEGKGAYGQEQFAWLGRASALISTWDKMEGITFNVATKAMAGNLNRSYNHGGVYTTIYKAIAAVEESIPPSGDQVFGPGAVYDFFRALTDVIASADKSLFVVDPYLDTEVFDGYLSSLGSRKIKVRLLANKYADNVGVAAEKFRAQHSSQIETRKTAAIHDRVIFVDDTECWVLGASIIDAGKKPTYLAPLSPDVVAAKLAAYEVIWATGTAI